MCYALIRLLRFSKHALLISISFGSPSFLRSYLGGILLINDGMLSLSSRCLLSLLLIIDHIGFIFTLIYHYDHVTHHANDLHDHVNDDDVNDLHDNWL